MPERVQMYGRRLTAQQRDERRQDNGDKKRLARQHSSYLLRSLTRATRTAQRHLNSALSFAISNFPRAPREAHDAHVYT